MHTLERLLISLLIFFAWIAFPLRSVEAQSYEHIRSFDVTLTVYEDATLRVTEDIAYDFGEVERHGIYRVIPYAYSRNSSSYKLRINVESVTDDKGDAYQYETSRSGGTLELKIGDPNKTISGVQKYVIEYTVARAINYFDTHDELFWNVTGTEWNIPITHASARIRLPKDPGTDVQEACYTGAAGSTASACTIDSSDFMRTVSVSTQQELGVYEGLSVVIGFPKNIVQQPSAWTQVGYFVQDNWAVFMPLLVLLAMHMIWRKKGKDPKGRGTTIPEYEPPDKMQPSLMGALWDERADPKDISATIIHLAIRGFIKISYITKKNYRFSVVRDPDASFSDTDSKIWEGLFSKNTKEVELQDLKNKFYKQLPAIKDSMYQSLIDHGYYPHKPQSVKGVWWGVASLFIFGAFVFGGMTESIVVAGAFVFSGIIVGIYASLMSRKTEKGAIAKERLEGFKWFLSVTEKERLAFHNAPEKKPEQFLEMLPYAMVLNVEKQWANQFKDMHLENPSWYEGQSGSVFTAVYFAAALSSMNTNMNSTFTSSPNTAGSGGSGFGGGGFSGGGFGGGGGGSW